MRTRRCWKRWRPAFRPWATCTTPATFARRWGRRWPRQRR
jgi:hypothetical protein